MLILLDRHSGQPVFRQIVEQVRFLVAGGMLTAGEELPSTRTLASDLGLNPMTVSKAYALLEQEGVVERRPGLPLMVRARPGAEEREERDEQFARLVRPAIAAARQLGLTRAETLSMFQQALDERGGNDDQA